MSENLRQYLQREFEARRSKNTRYSVRAFARDLGIDATALSRILKGARPIGPKVASGLLKKLKLDPAARETLLRSLVAPEDHQIPGDRDYSLLTSEQLERMDDWSYSALLELAGSRKRPSGPSELARALGLPLPEVERRLATLLELGLLVRTERGYRKAQARSTAVYRPGSSALKRIHVGYIAKAIDALESGEDSRHDITGITVQIAPEKLGEASRRIKEFRRSLAHFLKSEDGELYRINVQLFPLVRKK